MNTVPLDMTPKLMQFLTYFINTWLVGKNGSNLSPSVWNMYNYIYDRTNNKLEGFHSTSNNLVPSHPDIHKLINYFKKINDKNVNLYLSHKQCTNDKLPLQRRKDRVKDDKITCIQQEFIDKKLISLITSTVYRIKLRFLMVKMINLATMKMKMRLKFIKKKTPTNKQIFNPFKGDDTFFKLLNAKNSHIEIIENKLESEVIAPTVLKIKRKLNESTNNAAIKKQILTAKKEKKINKVEENLYKPEKFDENEIQILKEMENINRPEVIIRPEQWVLNNKEWLSVGHINIFQELIRKKMFSIKPDGFFHPNRFLDSK